MTIENFEPRDIDEALAKLTTLSQLSQKSLGTEEYIFRGQQTANGDSARVTIAIGPENLSMMNFL